ncbi:DNA polymerase V subunit [Enterobacter hormaechei]|nr:DNA polymerase V subunit [Enterobacter hormaechei]
MGFPSPAADYEEARLSLDERLIHKPAATYYMKASETIYRCGIMKEALLAIDSSLNPCDGSLLVCEIGGGV